MNDSAITDVLAFMAEGYNIVQYIGYDDRDYPYYLCRPPRCNGYKEKVPARVARAIITMKGIEHKRETNFRVWSFLRKKGGRQ